VFPSPRSQREKGQASGGKRGKRGTTTTKKKALRAGKKRESEIPPLSLCPCSRLSVSRAHRLLVRVGHDPPRALRARGENGKGERGGLLEKESERMEKARKRERERAVVDALSFRFFFFDL